jgi:hypothetical protein
MDYHAKGTKVSAKESFYIFAIIVGPAIVFLLIFFLVFPFLK